MSCRPGLWGGALISVSVNFGHILISLIVRKKKTTTKEPKPNNPLPPSSPSELCTWLVKMLTEAHCLLCFLVLDPGCCQPQHHRISALCSSGAHKDSRGADGWPVGPHRGTELGLHLWLLLAALKQEQAEPSPLDGWTHPGAVSLTFYWVYDRQMVPKSVFKGSHPSLPRAQVRPGRAGLCPGLLAYRQQPLLQEGTEQSRAGDRSDPAARQLSPTLVAATQV